MEFKEVFEKIQKIVSDKMGINLIIDDYDSFIVKKMASSNCISKEKSSHQSHIAITGKQMDLFPYLYSKAFVEESDSAMKNFFVFKAPITIYRENCNYLNPNHNINFYDNSKLNEEMCVYTRSGGEQVQLSIKNNGDSKNFISYRELIIPNTYWIVFKKKNELFYESIAIKEEDGKDLEVYNGNIYTNRTGKPSEITFVDSSSLSVQQDSKSETLPFNRIYFGAPGTGKSYGVSKLIKSVYPNFDKENDEQSAYVFRTTLHPEYSYSDFVGQIMPVEKEDGFDYSFTPGVFTRALKKAMLENLAVENGIQEEPKKVFLVLEELSRANVAAVFGDLFQLLDRDNKGKSEYSISNAIISKYVNTITNDTQEADEDKVSKDVNEDKKIFLPSNLIILATVNTNDQNVFAMDTAFKRRFEWEYVSIDPVSDKDEDVLLNNETISIPSEVGLNNVQWCDFYPVLNEYITSNMGLSEDKQIGQFFIKLAQDNNEKNQTQVLNKLLQYLWEDIEGMAIDTHLFNIEEFKSFGKLYSVWKDALDKGTEVQIFATEFYNKLRIGTKVEDEGVQGVINGSSEGEQNDRNQD